MKAVIFCPYQYIEVCAEAHKLSRHSTYTAARPVWEDDQGNLVTHENNVRELRSMETGSVVYIGPYSYLSAPPGTLRNHIRTFGLVLKEHT